MSKPVVIYGAGVVGKALLDRCKLNGIDVIGFKDRSPELIGKTIHGLRVYGPDYSLGELVHLISVMNMRSVVEELHEKRIPFAVGGAILGDIDTTQTNPDYTIDDEKYQIESCQIAHRAYYKKDYTFLRSIDVMITEKCSLKCRDCSNLMQYFEHPKNYDIGKVIEDVDKLLENVDGVLEARVLGGDAFMHPEWYVVVNHLASSSKVKRVVIYTNGVIVPNYFMLISLEKLIFAITDYGKLSRNLKKLTDTLTRMHLWHKVTKPDEWVDCSSIRKHNRTDIEHDKLSQNCVANNLTTLVDGKVFRCPYAASVYLLGIKTERDDYFLLDMPAKKLLNDYINSDKAMSVCDYCDSRILSNKIEPAIQTKEVLKW